MVADRRFGPLTLLVVLGLVVLSSRLFQIQVRDRDVWAREAANLLRSSTVVPYHRGRIFDRKGRALVRDEDIYQVELVYRTFRRGHPLGQVAHAWSSLTLQPLSLEQALVELDTLALMLVELSPAQIEAFAKGAALPDYGVPVVPDPAPTLRSRRASDLRFYIGALLGFDRRDWAKIRAWRGEAPWERSLLELACRVDGARDLDAAVRERAASLAERMRKVPRDLDRLAEHFRFGSEDDVARTPVEALVHELELSRRAVEDGIADELFTQAAGFGPGRLSTAALASFGLDWIARLLRWDRERLETWIVTSADRWRSTRNALARRLRHDVSLAPPERRAERLLNGLSAIFARPDTRRSGRRLPQPWRRVDEIAVLSELDDMLAGKPRAVPDLRLAFQDPKLREEATGGDGWGLAARVLALEGEDPEGAAAFWRDLSGSSKEWLGDEGRDAVARVIDAWEERLRAATDVSLAEALDGEGDTLVFAEGRLARARERERYVIKDRSSRSLLLQLLPPYEVVHLLTRYHELYRGFVVRDATRRVVLERYENGTPVAGQLIGRVRQPDLQEVLRQRTSERELSTLKKKTVRTDEDRQRIVELTAELLRDDEMRGNSGVEGYFDSELRGRNGYRETDGLQERAEGRGGSLSKAPVDGRDVVLTLDLELQRAAQQTLAQPIFDRNEAWVDRLWLEHPVGAIVLMTPDGEVLVATSEPTADHPAPVGRLEQRAYPIDRTMRRPTFNPPGSVLKPFVAAWALEHYGLDPEAMFECSPLSDGLPGYKVMHCTHQHGEVDVDEALRGSCNAYFARVGDEFYDAAGFMSMAHAFGFDRPCGVRSYGSEGRTGFLDQYWFGPGVERALVRASNRMRATNGLGHVDATPMQVARATAGLLTGELPAVRLVRSVGGEPIPASLETIDISEKNLARVRRAMEAVVTASDGTAHKKGLDRDSLGFSIAIKTGSADYAPFRSPEDDPRYPAKRDRMRKHTWITGWFPVEDPRAVFVVYLHDVSETSSHTAVWIARQFLESPEVWGWLQEPSAATGGAGATEYGRNASAIEASAGEEER